MSLRWLFLMYLRARINTWLNCSEQAVYVNLSSMEKLIIATFSNGKQVRNDVGIPDVLPPDWSQDGAGE
jgi:hypothetical protein